MTGFVALPLLVVLPVALAGGRMVGRLRPITAARSSAILIATLLLAAVPTLWLMGLSGLAHSGVSNPIVDWSYHLLPDHHPVGAAVGMASLLIAIVGSCRVAAILILHRRLRCTETCPLQIVDTDDVFAYTLPGPAGTIAISTGLRRVLDDSELDVVIAHERAHARHRHDRYKLLALVTTAFVPPARAIATRLDHALERWADEEAVAVAGVDRRLAARAIAKVALAKSSPVPAMGIADHGVTSRAAALLSPPQRPALTTRLQSTFVLTTAILLSVYQLHHSVLFATELIR